MYSVELSKYFGWLKLSDANDVEWAINYLVKKGIYPSRNVIDRNAQFLAFLAFDIDSGINPYHYALTLDKMKRAYSSRQSRHDPSKVSVTYLMSKKAKAALEMLAKDSKEIHKLEDLILKSEELKRSCRDDLREKKQELERRFLKREESLALKYRDKALVKENEKLRLALDRTRAEATKNDNFYKGELRRAIQLEVSAGIQHRSVAVQLSDEEQQEVQKRYIARLKPDKSGNYQ